VIFVDTSVWIDFFAGRDLRHVAALEQFIRKEEDLALCGIILTEILQGIASDSTYHRVHQHLQPLIMLPMPERVFIKAANIYRSLRRQGTTIRKTNDCIIAATVLEHRCHLLHNDRDFEPIARYFSMDTIDTRRFEQ